METTLLFLACPPFPFPSPPPLIQQCSQGLCGEALGKRGPLSSIHPAGGLAHARPAGRSFLGGVNQPPPTLMAAPQFHHFLEPQGFGCDPSQKMVGSPIPYTLPTLPHSHTGTRAVGTADSSWALMPGSAQPQPIDLREGRRDRPLPWKPPARHCL